MESFAVSITEKKKTNNARSECKHERTFMRIERLTQWLQLEFGWIESTFIPTRTHSIVHNPIRRPTVLLPLNKYANVAVDGTPLATTQSCVRLVSPAPAAVHWCIIVIRPDARLHNKISERGRVFVCKVRMFICDAHSLHNLNFRRELAFRMCSHTPRTYAVPFFYLFHGLFLLPLSNRACLQALLHIHICIQWTRSLSLDARTHECVRVCTHSI